MAVGGRVIEVGTERPVAGARLAVGDLEVETDGGTVRFRIES